MHEGSAFAGLMVSLWAPMWVGFVARREKKKEDEGRAREERVGARAFVRPGSPGARARRRRRRKRKAF